MLALKKLFFKERTTSLIALEKRKRSESVYGLVPTMKMLTSIFVLLSLLLSTSIQGNDLKPLMAIPGEIVSQNNFEKERLDKSEWTPRQRTQWLVIDGVLKGLPSSADNQAKRTHHRGLEPRGSAPQTPMNFVAKLSIRYSGTKSSPQTPFIEFGHHNCRVQFSESEGAFLLVESETKKVAEAKDFVLQSGKWYHILAEMLREEFVFQIEGGPTFYTKNTSFLKAADHHVGVAGFQKGSIEIDNFTIRHAKVGEAQENWKKRQESIPVFKPVILQKRVDQLAKKKAAEAAGKEKK